ncbi:DUF397 domain-containing protein [Dactylosporangium sp. NPDC005572]|uniref:DUF397 domain-containing protein n=1 Tax=Dactylosporangium sp. NPDC005572 TaxID=3156889 RepID=UPI0033A5B792
MAGSGSDDGWKVSGRCDTTNCVQVRLEPDRVIVRRSADEAAPQLVFHPDDCQLFVAVLKAGHRR